MNTKKDNKENGNLPIFSVRQRNKRRKFKNCPRCDGDGYTGGWANGSPNPHIKYRCEKCKGKGRIVDEDYVAYV